LLPGQLLHDFRRPVKHHALLAAPQQPPHHICAHSPKTNHPDLHNDSFYGHAPCRECAFVCLMLTHNRSIAAATAPPSPNTAFPATNTLAPASTTNKTVFASIPPSTSRSQLRSLSSIIRRTRRILGSIVWINCWCPKPGLTVMTST